MKTYICLFFTIIFLSISCSDDNTTAPTPSNTNTGGGSNNGCSGGPATVTDIDGNTYNVVSIGNQCWMKENLKVTKYRNGVIIPTGLSDDDWYLTTSGSFAIYENSTINNNKYGNLYNWYAVADPQGLCPTGWHVPTDGEWNILIKHLDPQADTSSGFYIQSLTAGGAMKTNGNIDWISPNTGATNSSGFSGLPGGGRDGFDGSYFNKGEYGIWWSATQLSSTYAWCRDLGYNRSSVFRANIEKSSGYSIRCIRD